VDQVLPLSEMAAAIRRGMSPAIPAANGKGS